MKLRRRIFLRLAAGGAVLPALPRIARAQIYPSRPVQIIVDLPAGLSPDVAAVHVPYRENYMSDLLSGQVQVGFPSIAPALPYIRSGKLRALAVTSAKRLDALPDIPAMDEFVAGYEGSGWVGVGAPKGTSAEIVDKLNKEINAVIVDPAMRARLVGLGIEPEPMTPAEFGKLIADATEKWARVIKFAGIKPE